MTVGQPLFLLGVSPRSGTNYLSDLVGLHPRCAVIRGIWEDFLLAEFDHLESYVEEVAGNWQPRWPEAAAGRTSLLEHLTAGCATWMASLAEPDELATARYVVANPLRAGLVTSIGDYPFWDAAWL